ncbi:MAG: PAS domain-containing protein, partial [Gammaproteobacteria bacterium]
TAGSNRHAAIARAVAFACEARAAAVLAFEHTGTEVHVLGHWSTTMATPPPVYNIADTVLEPLARSAHAMPVRGALKRRFPADPLLDDAARVAHLTPMLGENGALLGALCTIDARHAGDGHADAGSTLTALAARCASLEVERTRELAVREAERAWLELVVAGADAGMWDWNLVTDEVRFNARWARMLGRRLEDLAPTIAIWQGLVHPDDRQATLDRVRAHLDGHTPFYESEHRLRHADGEWRWVLDRGMVVARDACGQPTRMSGIHLDMTRQREEHALIRAEQSRFAQILEHTPVGLWEWDLDTGTLTASAPWLARLGYTGEHVPSTAEAWRALIHPEDRPRVLALKEAHLADPALPYLIEYRLATADGGWRWILSRANVSAMHADGRARCFSGVHIDIHAQRAAQAELREQERQFQHVVESAGIGLWEWDITRDVFTINAQLAAMLGTTPGEITDVAAWKAICHPDELPEIMRCVERHLVGETAYIEMEARARRRDGSWMWMLGRSHVAARDAAGQPLRMLGLQIDITARRQAEAARQESEARLRVVVDNSPVGIFTVSSDGMVSFANPAVQRMLGTENVTGPTWARLLDAEARTIAADRWARYLAAPAGDFEDDYTLRYDDGATREVHVRVAPVHSSDDISGFVGIVEDVTAARAAALEQERLRRQLQQAQKMEAIGQLTGGVAHDFNNILCSVLGFAALARRRFGDHVDGKLGEYLEAITSAGERGRDLVAKMLAFSRSEATATPTAIAAGTVIREAVDMLAAVIPSSIRFEASLDPATPPVVADPAELHQALVNLVVNARDASGEHGHIRVVLRACEDAHGECGACHRAIEGSYVELAVHDDGCGIAPDILPRLFEPFFTTKEVSRGTGLGLAVVHGVAHRAGGHVQVASRPGAGTTVRLLLPRADGILATETAPADASRQHRESAGLRVLLVDDEALVRRFVGEVLTQHGARVTVAGDGAEAAARLRAAPQDFDLLVTDQTMPRLTGTELIAVVRELRADLPVVLITGYAQGLDRAALRDAGVRVLDKPVDDHALLEAVADLVAAAPALVLDS